MSPQASRADRLVAAASGMIGTRFCLYGRDPDHGLDCIGLVACSLAAIGCKPAPPNGYRLRNADYSQWLDSAAWSDLAPVQDRVAIGDIILIEAGPGQLHLVIADGPDSCIHAHAGLRKVVRERITFPEKPLAHWRLV